MSRLPLTFACESAMLAGTLDTAPGATGLLLISGGNEIRSGAFSGQARLAADVAKAGYPVFRFDRRGVGDSEGENPGFRKAAPDITAALAAFHAMAPHLERVVGFGNCDAASTLMLEAGARCDALILSNPWTIEGDDEDTALPPSAVRARYAEKLRNPREVMRLLTGGVNFRKLAGGLGKASKRGSAASSLAHEMRDGLERFDGPVLILLAERDRTAQMFLENWNDADPRIARCANADHAYADGESQTWLREHILAFLKG